MGDHPHEHRSVTFPGASRALGSHPALRDGRPGVAGALHQPPALAAGTPPMAMG